MKIFDELAQRFVSSSSASRFSREFGRNNHTGTRGGQTSSSHRSTTVVHGRTQDYNCMVSGDAMFVSTNSTPLNNKRKRYTDDMDEGGDDLDVHIASKAKMMSLDRQVSDDSVGSYINGLNVLDFHNSSTWPNENISQSINSSASSKR